MDNCDDAYGFPPYPLIAESLYTRARRRPARAPSASAVEQRARGRAGDAPALDLDGLVAARARAHDASISGEEQPDSAQPCARSPLPLTAEGAGLQALRLVRPRERIRPAPGARPCARRHGRSRPVAALASVASPRRSRARAAAPWPRARVCCTHPRWSAIVVAGQRCGGRGRGIRASPQAARRAETGDGTPSCPPSSSASSSGAG